MTSSGESTSVTAANTDKLIDVIEEAYAPETKASAYERFLAGDSLDAISITLGIKFPVLRRWVKEGKWIARKTELEKDLFTYAELRYKKVISDNKVPVAERHLKNAAALDEAIVKTLTDITSSGIATPTELEKLAKALAASASVSGKVVGITEKANEDAADNAKAKVPLVVINNAAPIPVSSVKTITIEPESEVALEPVLPLPSSATPPVPVQP